MRPRVYGAGVLEIEASCRWSGENENNETTMHNARLQLALS
jgi:hypothetical protein